MRVSCVQWAKSSISFSLPSTRNTCSPSSTNCSRASSVLFRKSTRDNIACRFGNRLSSAVEILIFLFQIQWVYRVSILRLDMPVVGVDIVVNGIREIIHWSNAVTTHVLDVLA